jgi:hypothetical protein
MYWHIVIFRLWLIFYVVIFISFYMSMYFNDFYWLPSISCTCFNVLCHGAAFIKHCYCESIMSNSITLWSYQTFKVARMRSIVWHQYRPMLIIWLINWLIECFTQIVRLLCMYGLTCLSVWDCFINSPLRISWKSPH